MLKITKSMAWAGGVRPFQIVRQPRPMGLPCCRSCGAQMWLVSIETADTPDRDSAAFECRRCEKKTIEIKITKSIAAMSASRIINRS